MKVAFTTNCMILVDCKTAVFLRLVEMRGLVKRKVWSEGGNVE